jgi:hypothetical protein
MPVKRKAANAFKPGIEILRKDCLGSILNFLDFTQQFALMQVCKAWQPAATHAQNGQHVVLCDGHKGIELHYSLLVNYNPKETGRYLRCPPRLEAVPKERMMCFKDVEFYGICLPPYMPSLRTCKVATLHALSQLTAPNLRSLSMSLNLVTEANIPEIVKRLDQFPSLQRVVFCHWPTPRKIAQFERLLEALRENLTVESFVYIRQ